MVLYKLLFLIIPNKPYPFITGKVEYIAQKEINQRHFKIKDVLATW